MTRFDTHSPVRRKADTSASATIAAPPKEEDGCSLRATRRITASTTDEDPSPCAQSPFRLSPRQSFDIATGATSRADGVGLAGRIATPPTDAHTDVTAHARKQRAADTTDDSNAAARKQRSVTGSAAGRRKRPSPPQTADGAAGAVGVERGHGGENAAMIGPGVGIRTGGGRGDPFAALADVTRTSGGTNAPRPLCSPAPQDGPKTLTLTTNHSGYMNEEMELVDAVERVVYRYALVAIQFLDSSEAMEAALRRSRHVSFHQSPSSPPLDANGASSATMPRRVPDLRLPATLSSQSRHHHQRQQQRFPPTAAPQPPHAMAFAKTPLLPLKASGAEAAIGVDKGGIRRGGLPCRRTRQ